VLTQFATAVNCIDGRVQRPVIEWMVQRLWTPYVDMITEPGADKVLAEGSESQRQAVRQKVEVSVSKHGSRVVAVVGHHDCAGNPVSREEHWQHIRAAVDVIRGWDLGVSVVGIWVNEFWMIEVVSGDLGEDHF